MQNFIDSTRSKKLIYILFIALSVLNTSCGKKGPPGAGGPPGFGTGGFKPPPTVVEVIKATPKDFSNTLSTVGEIVSPETTEISSEIMGKIIYLNVPEGKVVEKGHVIARIEDNDLKAKTKSTEAKLKKAKSYYERMKALNTEGAISDQDLDDAIEALDVAEAELEDTKAVQNRSEIKAPFTGSLSFKNVSLGSFIDPGNTIVRITQLNPLDIHFALPEKYISHIKVGQSIKFSFAENDKTYFARVRTIDPYVDPESRSVQIKGIINNKSRELLPGRFANVHLEVSKKKGVLSIPQEALIQEGNLKKVYIVTKENIVEERVVKVGDWNDSSVQIVSGIKPNETVITSGFQKVRPGSKVETKPFEPIHNKELDRLSFKVFREGYKLSC